MTAAIARPARHLTDYPLLGVNFWSRTGGPHMWRDYRDDVVRTELETMRAAGIDLTRSFFFWPDFHPAPDVIDERMVDAYRTFLTTSDELGMRTIPTFLVGHMSGQDWDVPWREGRDLYTDPFMLDQQAWFIREMVSRLGDAPALAGWLITNEFTHYAGFSDRASVRAWMHRCVRAVRDGGSTLPVSLGDGAWGSELTGVDNGFRLRDQVDLVDFFGPHNYKTGSDQVRVHSMGAWFCELAHFGIPVILEEFGVSSSHCSEQAAADLYRQNLHLSLLSGATGWMPWNNTDFDRTTEDPYRHHAFELAFGLTRVDGTPKQTLHEVADFRRVLDAVDFVRTRRADTATTVLLSSYLDEHPRIPAEERPPIATIAQHAYIAGKRAGLAPALQRELDEPRRTSLVLVPSNKFLTAPTFDLLEEWARVGSHIYLAWFSGTSPNHRGAWWPDVDRVVGLPHQLRYGIREAVDEIIEWTFVEPLGDLRAGEVLRFPTAGSQDARHMLPVDDRDLPAGVTIIARDQRGRPALVRRRVGTGAIYTSTYAIEYYGSERSGAHEDDAVAVLYRALGVEAGALAPVTVDSLDVIVDSLIHDDGREFYWLINVSQLPRTVHPSAPLLDLESGTAVDSVTLAPFGVRVLLRAAGAR
jgi:endo-1,4-beta-mannosidase